MYLKISAIAMIVFLMFGCSKKEEQSNELIPFQTQSGLYGFMDYEGNIKIDTIFQYARPFSEGLAAVRYNGKWGYIDEAGSLVISPKYEHAESFSEGYAVVQVVEKNEEYNRIINKVGDPLNLPNGFTEITSSVQSSFFQCRMHNGSIELLDISCDIPLGPFNQVKNMKNIKNNKLVYQDVETKKWGVKFIEIDGKKVREEILLDEIYDDIVLLGEENYAVKMGEKWGVADADGKVFVLPKYDEVWEMNDEVGLARVRKDNLYGFINAEGKEVISLRNNPMTDFINGLAVITVNGKYGYIDKSGKIVIEPKFDFCTHFSDDYAPAMVDNKWGLIDRSGKWISDKRYDRIDRTLNSNVFTAEVEIKKTNKDGRKISEITKSLIVARNEPQAAVIKESIIEKVRIDTTPYRGTDKHDENILQGLITTNGIEIQSLKNYQFGKRFEDGLISVNYKGKYGFVDQNGTLVIPPKYDDVESFEDGLAKVQLKDKWGYIDKYGKEVIPIKYDNVTDVSEGIVGVELNKASGFVDITGKEVTPLKYESIGLEYEFDTSTPRYFYYYSFAEGLAPVKLNGKWGFIDKSGKEVIPLIYDDFSSFKDGLAAMKHNNKWGYIDKSGKNVIPLKYDDIGGFRAGFSKVFNKGKWGYINKSGKEVVPLIYQEVDNYFEDGFIKVKQKGKWGYVDTTGKVIIPTKYDEVSYSSSDKIFKVKQKNNWQYFNVNGDLIPYPRPENQSPSNPSWEGTEKIPAKFHVIRNTESGLYIASYKERQGVVDKNGTIIIPFEYNDIRYSDGIFIVSKIKR